MANPNSPRRPSSRPFTLLDAMILVAATAAALPAVQMIGIGIGIVGPGDNLVDELVAFVAAGEFRELGALLTYLPVPVGAAWTVALIPLRLRRPRPPWRRLARQPGLAAASAATLALAPLGLVLAWAWTVKGLAAFFAGDLELPLFLFGPTLVGAAVLGSWSTLVLGRRWRAERSWIDRLGRALGVYWIAMGLGAPALAGWIFY